MKAATWLREMEKADYDAMHKDYSESIDALNRAIAVLKKQAYDRKQAGSFTQVAALKSLSLIPKEAKEASAKKASRRKPRTASKRGKAKKAPASSPKTSEVESTETTE